jgi:hypothetical protein
MAPCPEPPPMVPTAPPMAMAVLWPDTPTSPANPTGCGNKDSSINTAPLAGEITEGGYVICC